MSDLLAELRAERKKHRAGIEEGYDTTEGHLCIHAECGGYSPCIASRALDCAIALAERMMQIEEVGQDEEKRHGWAVGYRREAKDALIAAARAYHGEGEHAEK